MIDQFDQTMTEFISLTMARAATADNGYSDQSEALAHLATIRRSELVAAIAELGGGAREAALAHLGALATHAVAFAHCNAAATALHYLEVLTPEAAQAVLDALEAIQADGPKAKAQLDTAAKALLRLIAAN